MNVGWTCPRCHRGVAPGERVCPACPPADALRPEPLTTAPPWCLLCGQPTHGALGCPGLRGVGQGTTGTQWPGAIDTAATGYAVRTIVRPPPTLDDPRTFLADFDAVRYDPSCSGWW